MDPFVADAIFIDASPERVFTALIDPDDLLEWLAAEEATVAPGVDGEYAVVREDGSRTRGVIAELAGGRSLRIRDWYWERRGERRGPMTVTFRLDPEDDGVWLHVRQDGLDGQPGWQDFAVAMRRQWVEATVALKRYIEGI